MRKIQRSTFGPHTRRVTNVNKNVAIRTEQVSRCEPASFGSLHRNRTVVLFRSSFDRNRKIKMKDYYQLETLMDEAVCDFFFKVRSTLRAVENI